MPLGISNPALDDLERADATASVGLGAVWDSSALRARDLGGAIAQRLRNTLPTSQLPHAVLNDFDAIPLKTPQEGESQISVGYDAEAGQPAISERPAAAIQRTAELLRQALDIARAIHSTTMPTQTPTTPGRWRSARMSRSAASWR